MTDYGKNFGTRRSAQPYQRTESRFRTPVGSSLLIGSMVEIDFANAGFLKQSAANAKLVSGVSGVLIQELEWLRSIYQSPADLIDSWQMGVAKANMLANITSGDGYKFWVKNTPSVTRADGRVISARTLVDSAIVAGNSVGWDGSKWIHVDGTTITNAVGVCTNVTSTGVVEIVLNA